MMKNIALFKLLLLMCMIGLANTVFAQVSAYPFSTANGTYSPITGGLSLGNTTTDDQRFVDPAVPLGGTVLTGVGIPIGFNFVFNGYTFDRLAVNANGWISFGMSSLNPAVNNQSSSSYTGISATSTAPAALQNRVAPFARDLQAQAGATLRVQTIGVAPSRICVVQWENYRRFAGTGDNLNFQIRLYETSNVVEVVFGTFTMGASTTAQVGLRGNTNADYNNRQTTTNWAATTAGTANTSTCTASATVFPASGLILRWGQTYSNDAGVSAMVNPVLPAAGGVQNFDVTVNNYGINVINNATVEWSINGVLQAPFAFTGPLAPGANSTVGLGSATITPTPANYKFWTSLPNGLVDSRQSNDTLNRIICSGLSGAYTVGTATSDFPTFAAALSALYNCGVVGPVTMNVQPGTYSGSIRFSGQIPGASATNTVTFDGASRPLVTLTHNGSGALGNGTVAFDNVRFVTFQNMTIRSTGTSGSASWGVFVTNNSQNIKIINNHIEVPYTSGIFDVIPVVFSASYTNDFTEGNNAHYCTIQGNTLVGGEMGIHIEGADANRNKGNKILNNIIYGADDYALYLDDQDSIQINGNTVYDIYSNFGIGFYIFDIMDYEIMGNNIHVNDYGIYIADANFDAVPTTRGKVFNNMVRSNNDYAFFIDDLSQSDFYHNTFYGGTSTFVAGFYIDDYVDVNIRNNIFACDGGYAFNSVDAVAFASMNHNLFYVPAGNTNFIKFGTPTYATLAAWQAASFGHDANSVSGDPVFISPTDLHVDGALANNAGDNSVGILVDIDGDVRPAAGSTTVDIGADEFIPRNKDAGVIAMLSPVAPLQSGFQPVSVRVKNFGIDPLTSFRVEWSYNGVLQGPVNYIGAPVASNTTVVVNLGNINFFPNTDANMMFWTSNPNNGIDERFSNDTLRAYVCPGLVGTFTVGTPSSSFPTLAAATQALYECGVAGNVTFQLAPGVYSGNYTLTPIPGSSAANRVTFDGMDTSLVTFTHDGSGNGKNATILLNGVDNVTFKRMKIVTTGLSGADAYGVMFTNAADNNQLLDNKLIATYAVNIFDVMPIVFSSALNDDFGEGNNGNYALIQGNDIIGGEMGIHIEGANFQRNRGNRIINNSIHGFDDYGIYIDDQDSIFINGNVFYDQFSTVGAAIYSFDIMDFEIVGNNIRTRDWGIYINDGNFDATPTRRALIANNMVISDTDDAIYMDDVVYTNLWFNTFYSRGTVSANGLYMIRPFDLDIRNNIFAAQTNFAFENPTNTTMAAMDYNNFYTPTGNNAVRWITTTYTFNNWRTTGPQGYDQNSLGVNPLFVNPINNAHIQSVLLNGAADSTVAIYVDIDGDVRPMGTSTRPDIGADEINVIANDAMAVGVNSPAAGVCESASQDVIVVFGNNGQNTITNATIMVNVTGPSTANFSFNYTGSLAPGANDVVNVGTINTTGGGRFCFEVITQLAGDGNSNNDTTNVCVNIAAAAPTVVPDTACINTPAYLTTIPAGGAAWYDAPTLGTLLSTADTFTTAPITTPTTFYVEIPACGTTRYPVSVEVVVPTPISLGLDTTICSTGTATIAAPTSAAYMWSTGATTQSVSVNAAMLYDVTVTDANGCKVSDDKEVFHFAAPSITAVLDTIACGNGSDGDIDLTLTSGNGPYSFIWANGATTEDVSGLNVGTYTVTVVDAGGCQYYESYDVFGPPSISFTAINSYNTACSGSATGAIQIAVTGGDGNYSFAWSNGATTQNVMGLIDGTYAVTVTDGIGCSTSVSTTVVAAPPIVINLMNITQETVNFGGSIDLSVSGGTAPYYFVWSTGQTTEDIVNLVAGTYTITVFDFNGCSMQASYNIQYNVPQPVDHIAAVNSLKVYPNPTSGMANIELSLSQEMEVRLDIFSVTGQLINSYPVQSQEEQVYQVDLSNYSGGVYMARLIIGNEVITTKIILQK